MIAISGLVLHSVVSAEGLLSAILRIFGQEERRAEYLCLCFIGIEWRGFLQQIARYDNMVQQSPFSLVFIAAEMLAGSCFSCQEVVEFLCVEGFR